MRLLVVDDNAKLRQLLVGLFTGARYTVDGAGTADDALECLAVARYDLVLMEWTLPDCQGGDLLRAMRRRGLGMPVLIGTAVTDLESRIEALDDGADDFMVKPFSSDELLARVRALLRRPPNILDRVISVGNVSLDLQSRALLVDGDALDMPRREIAVLEMLMRNRARLVHRRVLEEAVYCMDEDFTPNAIEAAISRVRKRLDGAGASIRINATRGLGYVLSERPC
jgi:DNA-binding response OmpR family regulator